jgi:hypothetical protein
MVKLASLTGYTAGSASVTFGNIKRKLKLLGEGLAADGPATPKKGGGPGRGKTSGATPKSSGKRGASKAPGTAEDETPTKRAKKVAPKKKREDDDDDDEHSLPNVKREEVEDLNSSAMDFYDQMSHAVVGYASHEEHV